jgi:hypothetical protein
MLDVASINPQLQPKRLVENYFATTATLKRNAGDALLLAFNACNYTSYVVNNTTSGLVSVLIAAVQSGKTISLQGAASQHYSPYFNLFKNINENADWHVRTHISPITGLVDNLQKEKSAVLIVDAAQSFGTCLFPDLLKCADVIIAPLHKHVGLVAGLAVVWVKNTGVNLTAIHAVMEITQNGCASLDLLEELDSKLKLYSSRISNRASIFINDDMRAWCHQRELSICGNSEIAPFACITTNDGKSIQSRLKSGDWKYFESYNTARFSYYSRGSTVESLVDFSEEFRNAIDSQLK